MIGEPPQDRAFDGLPFPPTIEDSATVEAFAQIDAGTHRCTYIGHDVWVMKGVHVGHDAWVGPDCELTPGVVLCGWVTLVGRVRVGVGAVLIPYVMVGEGARIGAGAVVLEDVPPGEVWAGNPARRLSTSPVYREGEGWQEMVLTRSGQS